MIQTRLFWFACHMWSRTCFRQRTGVIFALLHKHRLQHHWSILYQFSYQLTSKIHSCHSDTILMHCYCLHYGLKQLDLRPQPPPYVPHFWYCLSDRMNIVFVYFC